MSTKNPSELDPSRLDCVHIVEALADKMSDEVFEVWADKSKADQSVAALRAKGRHARIRTERVLWS